MANHAVVRLDRLEGTGDSNALISIEYLGADGKTPTDLDNGNVLKVGALMAIDATNGIYEREVFVGAACAANDKLEDIVLVASPEVMYDERLSGLEDFYNVKGHAARAYRLRSGDIFSVTKEALADGADANVGDVISVVAGTKLKVGGNAGIGKVIAKDVVGRYTFNVIKID